MSTGKWVGDGRHLTHPVGAGRPRSNAAHNNGMQITTSTGTTIAVEDRDGDRVVTLTNENAPADLQQITAGRVIELGDKTGFQTSPLYALSGAGMTAEALRAVADLIDNETSSQ